MIAHLDNELQDRPWAITNELRELLEEAPRDCIAQTSRPKQRNKRSFRPSAALVGRQNMGSVEKVVAVLLFLCVLTPTTRAWATDYFVSHRGNDSNPGTLANPWRSITKVNRTALRPGDRVLFEGGQTFDGNLALDERAQSDPEHPITMCSFGPGRARIHAGLGTGIAVRNLGGIVLHDLTLVGDDASRNQGFGILVVNERGANRLHFIRIENVEASGFHWAGIYVGGVPTILHGFKAPPGSRFGFRNVAISHSIVHHNMYCGILVSGSWTQVPGGYANEDVTIRDCLAHDNWGDPDYLKHHSGDGILLDDTDGGLIERCTACRNGGANGSRKSGPVGIWADASNRITIRFCESYANRTAGEKDGGGFDLDGGVSNSLVQYNYSHDNDGPGFLVWNYSYAAHPLTNNVIRYNLSENDGRSHHCGGIEIGTTGGAVRNIEAYNNTVIMTKHSNIVPSAVWITGSSDNENIHFRNNLLMTDGEAPLVEVENNQTGVVFQGNAYWCRGRSFLALYGSTKYPRLSTWRAQTGQETFRGKDVGMFRDPHLGHRMAATTGQPVNRRRLLSRLDNPRAGSPLIDGGLDLQAEFGADVGEHDFFGIPIPQGRAFDIGAFEAPAGGEMNRSGISR